MDFEDWSFSQIQSYFFPFLLPSFAILLDLYKIIFHYLGNIFLKYLSVSTGSLQTEIIHLCLWGDLSISFFEA